MVVPTASGAERPSRVQGVERALALLSEALQIIDAERLSPEIGARLSDVITAIEEHRPSGAG